MGVNKISSQGWRDGSAGFRTLALAEDLSSNLSTHIRQLTVTWDSRSMGSNALFWPLQALVDMYTYPYIDILT